MSHEIIYRSLFVQARGVLKKERLQHLRTQRVIRRSKHSSPKRDGRGQISNAVSIRQRPPSVEDRAVAGHWEGDLSKNSYMATLVEGHSRYVMLAKVDNKESQTVVSALIKQAQKLPKELSKSLTWDRGRNWQIIKDLTWPLISRSTLVIRGVCGSVDLMKILTDCFDSIYPKGTDSLIHSQAELNQVARQLNERPRKTLGFEIPAERFSACVASTS